MILMVWKKKINPIGHQTPKQTRFFDFDINWKANCAVAAAPAAPGQQQKKWLLPLAFQLSKIEKSRLLGRLMSDLTNFFFPDH